MVLLAGLELHLGRFDQTLSTKDAIDGGLGDGEALAVGEPCSQLATAQLYCRRKDSLLLLGAQPVGSEHQKEVRFPFRLVCDIRYH